MRAAAIALILPLALLPSTAPAVNVVRIDSIRVAPGQRDVSMGVYIENDVPIQALVLPLEIRTLSGDAYLAPDSFSWGMIPYGRLACSPLGHADSAGRWPAANITTSVFAAPADSLNCSGPVSASWRVASANPDFESPDAVLFVTLSQGDTSRGEQICLLPGVDSAGSPSLQIVANVNAHKGAFVVDTCCRTPGNHLLMLDDAQRPVAVEFRRGLVTIAKPGPLRKRR